MVRTKTYRGHRVEFDSEKIRTREWIARATIVIADSKKEKRIPIFGRRRGTFETQRQADAYALEQGLKARQTGPEFMRAANPSVSGAPSETNQSMFRCIAGSEYYSPYDCNPGEVGYSALKIADELHPVETGAGTSPPEAGPTEPTPPEATPTKLKLLKLKRNRQRGVAFIQVHVSGKGRLILSGPTVRRAVRTPKVSRGIWIPIRPKGKAIQALDTRHHARVKVTIVFVPDAGAKVISTRTVTLFKK